MSETNDLTPPLKWHGGKHYLAGKIVAMMPPHVHYVEPFAGGLAVLLAKDPEGVSEVVNDLDGELITFWRVIADEDLFAMLKRRLEGIPFSRETFEDYDYPFPDCVHSVERALAFFVRVRQSLAGRRRDFAPLSRKRTRRGMNEQVSAWLTAIEGLPAVHARLRRVVLENMDAIELISREDGPETLYYCDPPYLQETRADRDTYGDFEMSNADHARLLHTLVSIKGKFLLSGYRSAMYDYYADTYGWKRVDFDLPNNAAGGSSKRRMVESVWMNYEGFQDM